MLVTAYLLIVTILLYATFKSKIRLPVWVDTVCIAIVVWFGIALWHAPCCYKGWPLCDYPENGTYVKDYMVIEPDNSGNEGVIYIFGINFKAKDGKSIVDPRNLLKPGVEPGTPRLFQIPYSKEEQKKVQKKRNTGDMIFWMSKGNNRFGKKRKGEEKDETGFQVINVQQLLLKEDLE